MGSMWCLPETLDQSLDQSLARGKQQRAQDAERRAAEMTAHQMESAKQDAMRQEQERRDAMLEPKNADLRMRLGAPALLAYLYEAVRSGLVLNNEVFTVSFIDLLRHNLGWFDFNSEEFWRIVGGALALDEKAPDNNWRWAAFQRFNNCKLATFVLLPRQDFDARVEAAIAKAKLESIVVDLAGVVVYRQKGCAAQRRAYSSPRKLHS